MKRLALSIAAIAVCCLPLLSPTAFFILLAGVFALAAGVCIALLLELWSGFRKFEEWTLAEFNRLTGKR